MHFKRNSKIELPEKIRQREDQAPVICFIGVTAGVIICVSDWLTTDPHDSDAFWS